MPSSYSEFRRVICFICCIHPCIMCIASCHHAIISLIFKTLLNKLHRSFDLFKPRELTGWLLFITYPPILGSYIKYSTILESPKHTYKIISFLLCFKFGLQPCQYLFHHFPELHQKSEHFWTFPKPHFLFKSFELIQMNLNLNLSVMPTSIFPGSSSFLWVRENCLHAQIPPLPSLSLLSLFCFFCKWKRIGGREEKPSRPLGPV